MKATKRGFLIGGLAAAAQARAPALAQSAPPAPSETMAASAFGCAIAGPQFRAMRRAEIERDGWFGAVAADGGARRFEDRLTFYDRSDNQAFDRMLGRALVEVTQIFGVYPGFRYYEDASGRNAMASHECLSVYDGRRCDGTVVFGVRLAFDLLRQPAGDAAIIAICAHEWAHVHAFKRDLMSDLIVAGLPPRPFFELHADFMAGVFLRQYTAQFPALDVRGVARTWAEMGSSNFNDPGSHGTTEMRRVSIDGGWRYADGRRSLDIDAAYDEGLAFLAGRSWL